MKYFNPSPFSIQDSKFKIRNLFTVLFLTLSLSSFAQPVANFTLTNTLDGKTISLDQYASLSGVAIIFYSNECPFDNYYKERLRTLIEAYKEKIQFVLINPYQEPQESAEKMTIHYGDLNVPYLSDKDQTVMNMLGAKKSPEVFLLKSSAGKFSVFYNGAIDDNAQVEKDVSNTFLKNAIDLLLAGKPAPESNRAVGCSIRRK